jgi:hypothetical protein
MWCSGSEKLQEMVWYTLSNSKRFLSNQAEELSKKNIRRPTSWIGTSSRANFNSNTVAGNLNKLQNWRSTFTSAPHEQNHTWQQITGDWQRFCNLTQPVRLADGWSLLRVLLASCWFVVREKYCWLVVDKSSEQGASCYIRARCYKWDGVIPGPKFWVMECSISTFTEMRPHTRRKLSSSYS